MNFKIVLWFSIVFQSIFGSNILHFSSLPKEIKCIIKNKIRPFFDDEPVLKFNNLVDDGSYHRDRSLLIFPSTNSFTFISIPMEIQNKSSYSSCSVIPSIGLRLNPYYPNCIHERGQNLFFELKISHEKIFFDVNKKSKVVCAKNANNYLCLVRFYLNNTKSYYDNRPDYHLDSFKCADEHELLSFCLHPIDDEFSIIQNSIKDLQIQIFDVARAVMKREFTIPAPLSGTIKRHEYIDKGVFLLQDGENLFFCTEQDSGVLNIKLQSFFDNKKRRPNGRYKVISFCVNQDQKTFTGKARHFFLLAQLASSEKDPEQVILHVDLLNQYNTITKICSFKKQNNRDIFFDRIAFNKEGFCLWEDDGKESINTNGQGTPAMIIGFESDWMNVLEKKRLIEIECNNERISDGSPDRTNTFKIVSLLLLGGLLLFMNWTKLKIMIL